MNDYIVYVRTDADGVIISINSSAFLTDVTGWTQIDSGDSDKYHHAQGNYFSDGIIDSDGVYNYKLVDGKVIKRTCEDKQPQLQIILNETEISQLKQKLADTDYIASKIAEGAATKEEYTNELAERASWRARINELQNILN